MIVPPCFRVPAFVASLAFACFGALGCGEAAWETAYRLERAAALADVTAESFDLDFGTEEARRHLIDGWSFNETNDAGLTFVWSHGPTSSFGLYAFPDAGFPETPLTGPASLRFRALPLEARDAPDQVLRFELNGRDLGEITLPAGVAESTLEFPVQTLVSGWNVFDIHYAWTRSDLSSQADLRWRRAQRDLAVAWIEARLQHPALPQAPVETTEIAIDLRAEQLTLPAHHLIEYEFEIDRGYRLVSTVDCPRCAEDRGVDVYLGSLDSAAMRLAGSLTRSTRIVPLGAEGLDTHRLLLRNSSSGPVVLERPRIERPVEPHRH